MRLPSLGALVLLVACSDDGPTVAAPPPTEVGTLAFIRAADRPVGDRGVPLLVAAPVDNGSATPIATLDAASERPAASRDGRWIAWRDVDRQVWVLDRSTGARQRLTPALHQDRHPSWSPDGERLVLIRRAPDGREVLMTLRRDGSDSAIVLPPGPPEGGFPDWSPDGQWIAWLKTVPADQIEVMSVTGGERRTLTPPRDGFSMTYREPTWSPDGTRLAWLERARTGPARVVVASPEGAVFASRADQDGDGVQRPAWSPDGTRLAYCRSRDAADDRSKRQIVIWTIGAAAERVVPGSNVDDCDPVWFR